MAAVAFRTLAARAGGDDMSQHHRQPPNPNPTFCPICDPEKLTPVLTNTKRDGDVGRKRKPRNPCKTIQEYIETNGCRPCFMAGRRVELVAQPGQWLSNESASRRLAVQGES